MTSLARLKDCFLEQTPSRVLGCTYGFQPEFFEQEILPALMPDLALDRDAGNAASFLNAGDEALRRCPMLIVCDHHDPGRELAYNVALARKGSFAFHPKLLLVDYGDRLRAIVASANLTRSGWSSAFELFLFEDLPIGKPHSWVSPLGRFLEGTARLVSSTERVVLDEFVERLREVRPTAGDHRSSVELASSFDGPLLDVATQRRERVRSIDVVTPFLEGDEGTGVFDQLAKAYPGAGGSLHLRAEDADGTPIVRGPEAKLKALLESGRWEIRRVRPEWEGDEDDRPPVRELHGKLLALRSGRSATVMVGSANITSAALLGRAPQGANVELCCVLEVGSKGLEQVLPQSDVLDANFEIEPVEAAPDPGPTAADWVDEAIYYGASGELELRIASGAPPLTVTYRGRSLSETAAAPSWKTPLRLGKELEVRVSARSAEPATVPFFVLDLGLVAPRGMSRNPTLDELLEIMAGAREPVDDGDETPSPPGAGSASDGGMTQAGGALAWRKLMRALAGLERDLKANARFEPEVRRLLDGPLGAQGLMSALDALRESGEMLGADVFFAAHQLRLALLRVDSELHTGRRTIYPGSRKHVQRWIESLAEAAAQLQAQSDGPLRAQVDLLLSEKAR